MYVHRMDWQRALPQPDTIQITVSSRLNAIMKSSRLAGQTEERRLAFIVISHQGHKDGVEVVVRRRTEAETPGRGKNRNKRVDTEAHYCAQD